jgi:hypothetical protein
MRWVEDAPKGRQVQARCPDVRIFRALEIHRTRLPGADARLFRFCPLQGRNAFFKVCTPELSSITVAGQSPKEVLIDAFIHRIGSPMHSGASSQVQT